LFIFAVTAFFPQRWAISFLAILLRREYRTILEKFLYLKHYYINNLSTKICIGVKPHYFSVYLKKSKATIYSQQRIIIICITVSLYSKSRFTFLKIGIYWSLRRAWHSR
jgi:hypothetical protein